jgi:CubicO group peptidase (beta-lactamase class C family)
MCVPSNAVVWQFSIVTLCLFAVSPSTARADDVDAYVQAVMRRQNLPGVCIAVTNEGRLLKAKGYGLANVELDSPATPETVYQLASMTKPFTAIAIMLLVEEGRVRLDSRVSEYLKDTPSTWDGITVRHLLTMTSGIKDYGTELGDSTQEFDESKLFKVIADYPLDFSPGEKWSYCNSNYVLLASIVHKVTGKTWDAFLTERVFKPLKMAASRRDSRSEIIKKRASLYEWRGEALVNCRWVNPTLFDNGDGGLVTTVLDLAKFDAALSPGALLKRESLEQVWTPVSFGGRTLKHYGFGWYLNELGGQRIVLHGGGRPGTSTQFSRFLDARVSVVVLINRSGANAEEMAHEIARFFIGDLPPYRIREIEHPPRWDEKGQLIGVRG